jgi:hypothetical protein
MVAPDLAAGRLTIIDAPALAVHTPITVVVRRHSYLSRAAATVIELLGAAADG